MGSEGKSGRWMGGETEFGKGRPVRWARDLGIMKRAALGRQGQRRSPETESSPLLAMPVPTESLRSRLLASPTARRALSTSLWPGRQLTQRFRAWVTAFAT